MGFPRGSTDPARGTSTHMDTRTAHGAEAITIGSGCDVQVNEDLIGCERPGRRAEGTAGDVRKSGSSHSVFPVFTLRKHSRRPFWI